MRIPVFIGAMLLTLPLPAAIEGVVHNGTTGRPQSGVTVGLVKLEQGMIPVGTSTSDAAGKFRFLENASGELMLRAEYQGVVYNQRIPAGARAADVRLTVYSAAKPEGGAGAPEQHILLVEPSGQQMMVNESFLYRNQAQPPVTYADPRQGTLRFYLPAAAKGIVQISAAGPGGLPLRVNAEKTEQADIHKVDFAIKPGETRIDLTYLVPYQPPLEFTARTLYPGATTRLAVPAGVTVSGDGIESLGEEPQTKATIFDLSKTALARLTIAGEGRLARERDQESAGDQISVIPAAIQSKMAWILALASVILALGFYGLYTASGTGATPQRGKKKK